MKQNKAKVSLKSPLNGVKNDSIVKKQTNVNTPLKGTPSKATPKKLSKTPAKVVPPKKVDEEEENESEEEEDSGADVETGVADDVDESDNDDQEDDEYDEDDKDDEDDAEMEGLLNDEAEQDETDEDDEDGEPEESPIEKTSSESPTKPAKAKKAKALIEGGIPKIKCGPLPKTFPKNQILVVKNLPKNVKQIHIVEVFAKFGTLHTIFNIHGPESCAAHVAYTSAEDAEAAQAATNNIAKIKGATLRVTIQSENPKLLKKAENKNKSFEEKKEDYDNKRRQFEENKQRTIFLKNLKKGTKDNQVKEHFAECGDIESVKLHYRIPHTFGFVVFKEESSVDTALKLHNSILNDNNIWVVKADQQFKDLTHDPERTILIKNKQNLTSLETSEFEEIFSKCGEIERYSILCKKNVLAFVTFKDQKAAKKALKLNGTTAQGLELELEEYKVNPRKEKTTVFIQNVKPGVSQEDIRELFALTGPIESVNVLGGYATVKFMDTDSFCKAFLLNESILNGQMIFLEPYSERKQSILRNQHKSAFNRKRPAYFPKGSLGKRMRTN